MPHVHYGNSFGQLAASAAIGLVAGLALPQARKLVAHGPAHAAGGWMAALTAEHRALERLFDQLLATHERNAAKREILLGKIAYAFNKHTIEEENVIYPALSESADGERSHKLADEHLQAKIRLYDLRRLSAKDPQWIEKARELWSILQAHIREEEEEVFPALRDAYSAAENDKLTAMMNWEGLKAA